MSQWAKAQRFFTSEFSFGRILSTRQLPFFRSSPSVAVAAIPSSTTLNVRSFRGEKLLLRDARGTRFLFAEEWETRKKKEITTTRQIETRVKRQVVLEDGEVVVDSGPLVTTNTTEDVEQQEHTTQERRTTGDQPVEVEWPTSGSVEGAANLVQKELNETVVKSREEIEERLETEDRQQLGDISDETYQRAVRSNRGDLRVALAESSKQIAPQTGPRVVQHTTRSNKVVDTEKTLERKELKPDGQIVTERKRTVEREELKDDEVPDDGSDESNEASETKKEASQRFLKRREEDVVDYVSGGEKIAREMRYVAETAEGERTGDWSEPTSTMKTTRLHKNLGFTVEGSAGNRKDVLTKKSLDFGEENEARKFETSKWLESHFGSDSRSSHASTDPDDSQMPPATNTSYINVTMKSTCSPKERDYQNVGSGRHHRRSSGRDSISPSRYFHGISEWSERYQDKQNSHIGTVSPSNYVDSSQTNGHSQENGRHQYESMYSRTYEAARRHDESLRDQQRTPSPPVRRRIKEQWYSKSEEKVSEPTRTASPVHVVQRTWENRGRNHGHGAERETRKKSPTRSRSASPKVLVKREEKNLNGTSTTPRASKGSGQSKYKIGESFRKLVGKLRSASSERKNKRSSSNSTSQLTQTDDNGPTYMQYNVIDRNIPLVSDNVANDRPPERPPRSPRREHGNSSCKTGRTVRTNEIVNHEPWQRGESIPPVHRYYLGEDPFGGSIYGREKGYKDAKRSSKSRGNGQVRQETEYSSLGRFSKSTSRLASEHEREEHLRSTQTLPRNHHSGGHSVRNNNQQILRSGQRSYQPVVHTIPIKQESTIAPQKQARRYGSMINISIKNAVTSPKPSAQSAVQGPPKPERTYKSSLARSKSFNVEADRNGNSTVPTRVPYTSNSQLHRLDETPPLKSPGILASISRSNRDLFKDSRQEY